MANIDGFYRGKRLRFRCNRWIRPGQRIRTADGGEATIERVDADGVTYGDDGKHGAWSVTRPWHCVFGKSGDRMLNLKEAWRPVGGAQ